MSDPREPRDDDVTDAEDRGDTNDMTADNEVEQDSIETLDPENPPA